MSAATVSLTRKINGGNDLLSIGGTDAVQFLQNLETLLGSEDADAVVKEIHTVFVPTAAGAPAPWGQPLVPVVPPAVTAAFPQAQPIAATSQLLCKTHQQPAVQRATKDGSSYFWKCPINDSIISEFGKPDQIKPFCPAAKPR